jgi:hypothetical protein
VTTLEYYLVVVFAAVWLVPAILALRWEWRLRATARSAAGDRT